MNFEQTLTHLRRCKGKVATECFDAMANQDVHFHPGFSKDKSKLVSLYDLRLEVARENQSFKKRELEVWEHAMKKLRLSTITELKLNWVNTSSQKFLMFWSNDQHKLEGIFVIASKKNLEELEEYYQDMIDRGLTVESIKYSKGLKQKTWSKR